MSNIDARLDELIAEAAAETNHTSARALAELKAQIAGGATGEHRLHLLLTDEHRWQLQQHIRRGGGNESAQMLEQYRKLPDHLKPSFLKENFLNFTETDAKAAAMLVPLTNPKERAELGIVEEKKVYIEEPWERPVCSEKYVTTGIFGLSFFGLGDKELKCKITKKERAYLERLARVEWEAVVDRRIDQLVRIALVYSVLVVLVGIVLKLYNIPLLTTLKHATPLGLIF